MLLKLLQHVSQQIRLHFCPHFQELTYKAKEQYFHVMLLIMLHKVSSPFESVNFRKAKFQIFSRLWREKHVEKVKILTLKLKNLQDRNQ